MARAAPAAEEIAALRGTRPSSLKELLTHRSFSRLLRAMLVSSLGDWVGFVAVASLVARLGGERVGPLAVAGVMLARLLPSVLFGPFAGVFADRFDRRKLMVGSDVGRGVMYASMPFLPGLWPIFLISFLIECLSLPLWLDAFTFFFSARMVWGLDLRQNSLARLRAGNVAKLSFRSAVQEAKDGYRFLAAHPMIRAMTIGIVMAFAGVGAVISLGPVFARYSLNAGSTGFGILITAFGIGMGAGMGLMNLLVNLLEKDKLFTVAMMATAGCAVVVAGMPTLSLAALFTVPMGVGTGLTWVTGYTMIQENVTDEYRGRTFATLTISARMVLFVALVAFPALAAAIGPHTLTVGGRVLDFSGIRIALWAGAAVVIVGGMFSWSGLRRSRLARPRPLSLAPRLHKREGTGVLIVFEGVEGSGKGTQMELARRYLESKGLQVVATREPGGTGFGDRLRETILDPATGTVDPRAEALVFAAARAQLVTTVIRPALDEGKVVLCDRFIDSSVAYQGAARGLGEQDVLALNAWATQGLFPDLVILLHIEPEQGLARASDERDRFESEDLAFHAKVADAYLRIADEHPDRFHVVDAQGTPEEVHARVREGLDRLLAPPDAGPPGQT